MVLQMRTSERTALKRCPQKWYWSYVEGLEPHRAANPLWFGSAVHDGLAEWYQKGQKRGPHPAETFAASLEGDRSFLVTNEEEEAEYADARTLGIDMLEHYVEHYGTDDQWDIIATEQTFQVWLPHPTGTPKRWLRYVGTFDGVERDRDTGEVWLLEHKTAASIDPEWLSLDDQAGSYWAIASAKLRKAGVLKPGEEIAGVLYNFLRKAMRDTRPVNEQGLRCNKPLKAHYIDALANISDVRQNMKLEELEAIAQHENITVLGEVSKSQPPPYFERFPIYRTRGERATMLGRIKTEAWFAEQWRAGTLPLYKTPVSVGVSACRGCPFYRMCQLHEQGDSAWQEFRDTMYTHRDPYADHDRKSTGG